MLTLAEEMMLIGLNDDKGSLIFTVSDTLPFGLAAAAIIDLYLTDFITVHESHVKVTASSAHPDDALNMALDIIKSYDHKKNIHTLIHKIEEHHKDLMDKIIDNLIGKGVLKKEEHKVLWLIHYDRYPTKDPVPEMKMRQQVRDCLLNCNSPGDKLLALLSLIKACDLTNELFKEGEREAAQKCLGRMTSADFIQTNTNEVLSHILTEMIDTISEISNTSTI